MPKIGTNDRTEIFYKDWGSGQPVVFSHGWPLSADDWDLQLLFFLKHGYRVIAHDRRDHGRSTQTGDGHNMLCSQRGEIVGVVIQLDLREAMHVGHSTGGGEVGALPGAPWRKPRGQSCADRRGTTVMMKAAANPGGLPKQVFDDLQAQTAGNRAQLFTTCLPDRFIATTGQGQNPLRASSGTGGARA